MFVIRAILHNLRDDMPLSEQLITDSALPDLMLSYNSAVFEDGVNPNRQSGEELFTVSGNSLGVTLKDGISRLPIIVQHKLLNLYLQKASASQFRPDPPRVEQVPVVSVSPEEHHEEHEHPDEHVEMEREDRKFRRLIILIGLIGAVSLFLIVVGAIVAIMFKENKLPDNAILSTLMGTASEIIKVLFNYK